MNFDKILTELCWRIENGTPDLTDPQHLQELRVVLTMHKWTATDINELIENLTELKFKDKAAYVAYRANLKTGKMRPTTKVTIGGKETTAGEADGEAVHIQHIVSPSHRARPVHRADHHRESSAQTV